MPARGRSLAGETLYKYNWELSMAFSSRLTFAYFATFFAFACSTAGSSDGSDSTTGSGESSNGTGGEVNPPAGGGQTTNTTMGAGGSTGASGASTTGAGGVASTGGSTGAG